jgi:diguanylate cyclase (GGDEF)-like protein
MDSQLEDLLDASLGAYRSALAAIGESGAMAHPHYGQDLQSQLLSLQGNLGRDTTPDVVRNTEVQLNTELKQWAERTASYFKQKTSEVKEILLLMVAAAENVSTRDQLYTSQLAQISTDLQKVSDLEDLTSIRKSLGETTLELNRCVASMEKDGKETVKRLRAEIVAYQARVMEVERIASIDALTGLANRREAERQLEILVQGKKRFCVILFDLNGFKPINDQYGHAAGDDLLKQFAGELRRFFRPLDIVGRWGGDEFVVVLDCDLLTAKSRLRGMEKWLYGEYTIQTASGPQKVSLTAVAGAVDWMRGETVAQVVARADAAMYQRKKAVPAPR